MKKACELCERMASVHCESDEASLCWQCDAAVHSANFLVVRHSRKLLCHVCHSSTPWSVSGAKVGPAVSLCHQCVDRRICDENSGQDEEKTVTESSSSTKESDEEAVNSKKRRRLDSTENESRSSLSHLTMLKVQKTDSGRVGICDSHVLERFLRNEAGSGMEATVFSHVPRIAIDLNSPIAVDLNSF